MITKNSLPVAPSLTRTRPGVDLHVLGPAGDEGELLAGEGGEERHLGEVSEEGITARHGAGI